MWNADLGNPAGNGNWVHNVGSGISSQETPAVLEYAEDSISTKPSAAEEAILQPSLEETVEDQGSSTDSTATVTVPSPPQIPIYAQERPFGRLQEDDLKDVLGELAACTSVRCVIRAHDKIDGRTRFNLPHFFLIGWQKSATTSVNAHLRYHPQYLPGIKKEPHWFSVCQHNINAPHCEAKNETHYLRDFLRIKEAAASKLELVTLDASADYAQKGGVLARRLYRLFPWLKVVIMIREPISRVISYTRMHTQGEFDAIQSVAFYSQ